MRLQNYVTELTLSPDQEIWSHLKKNCSEFISFYKKMKHPDNNGRMFYRGMHLSIPDYEVFVPRKNRKPLSSVEWMQKMQDDALEKRFGWRPRSEGVFALSLYPGADDELAVYGKTYMFFPYDGYEYLWAPQIGDLFSIYPYSKNDDNYKDIETIVRRGSRNEREYEENLENWKIRFEKWMDGYIDDKLEVALNVRKGHEVMFKCKKYVMVNPKFEDSLIEKIWGDWKPL